MPHHWAGGGWHPGGHPVCGVHVRRSIAQPAATIAVAALCVVVHQSRGEGTHGGRDLHTHVGVDSAAVALVWWRHANQYVSIGLRCFGDHKSSHEIANR
eukprot:6548466-Prymnesium_polylepis.1